MSVSGERREDLIARYRDPALPARYLAARFAAPLGALLHARQAAAVVRAMGRAGGGRWLEVASGPGRFAPAARRAGARLVLVDTSLGMLRAARTSLGVAADAHRLPAASAGFDGAISFRFLRHLAPVDRAACYAEVGRVLRPGALFLFDAVNGAVSAPLRARSPGDYPLFDQLYTADELAAELAPSPFELIARRGVQRRYGALHRLQVLVAPRSRRLARLAMEAVDRCPGGEPLEWIVTCRRR